MELFHDDDYDVRITELQRYQAKVLDLFVCSASFEDRCLSVPNAIAQPRQSIVAYNEDYFSVLVENLRAMKRILPVSIDCPMRTDDPLRTDRRDRFSCQ